MISSTLSTGETGLRLGETYSKCLRNVTAVNPESPSPEEDNLFRQAEFLNSVGHRLKDANFQFQLFNKDDFLHLATVGAYWIRWLEDDIFNTAKNQLTPVDTGTFFATLCKKYENIWNEYYTENFELEDKMSRVSWLRKEALTTRQPLFDDLLSLIKQFPDAPIELLGELL